MPFADTTYPSLGLSLLKAGLMSRGIEARVHYLNLWFAESVDVQLYAEIVQGAPRTYDLAGEWIFGGALWGDDEQRDLEYVENVLHGASPAHRLSTSFDDAVTLSDAIVTCRQLVEPFLERCLTELPWSDYRVVGFSSIFQQQLAALALARRLKNLYPGMFVIFGGANVEGPMGNATFRSFPFIDAVCSGEGDLVFPELVQRTLTNKPIGALPGILHRQKTLYNLDELHQADIQAEPLAPRVEDLNALPYPDFADFFNDFQAASLPDVQPQLVYETSRGCWWGAKSHCTFCGLNASSMAFRHKSAQRALDEIQWLLKNYGQHTRSLIAVDNIIPYQYFKTFLPQLKKLNLDLSLFYETKANLNRELIELYRDVGLKTIQPGVESLSTPVLNLMKKGVSSLQNIQLLKWCRQFGVQPIWNFLVGFPNEKPEYYDDLANLVRSLSHLPPPNGVAKVRFDRFSPYVTKPADYGLRNLMPYPSYRYIYPGLDDGTLNEIAYYFTGEFDGQESVDDYTQPLNAAVGKWKSAASSSSLFSLTLDDQLLVCDMRPEADDSFVYLSGAQRVLYESCDSICSKPMLRKTLSTYLETPVTEEALATLLDPLLQQRLLLCEGTEYISLAVPLDQSLTLESAVRGAIRIPAMEKL